MSLVAVGTVTVGALTVTVDLTVDDEIVAVLGPNGAGKTTLLRALAGLQPLATGRLVLDGTVLDDPTAGVFVRPADRSLGMVFQDALLFPFLDARDNVAFGLRSRRVGRREARRQADAWLARVGLADRAGARPAELSGGQAQRVALARALAPEPRLLCLDEPLAALDAQVRTAVRRELRGHLGAVRGARVLVTHDPVDAAVLADRVVILEAGRVVQTGTMAEIALRPRSAYVADLVGRNLYRGVAADGRVTLPGGATLVVGDRTVTGEVHVAIHPRSVGLHRTAPGGSPRNHFTGTVTDLDGLGDRVRVRIEGAVPMVAEVTAAAAAELGLGPGRPVVASVKATEVTVYPA